MNSSETSRVTPSTATPSSSTTPSSQSAAAVPASKPPLTTQKLKNAEYYILVEGPIKLKDGKATDNKNRTFTLGETLVYGDLNKDAVKDAIAPLTITINGRNFVYLVTVLNEGGNPKNSAAEFVGEDVAVTKAEIKAGKIVATITSPGVTITRTYEVKPLKAASSPSPTATPASPQAAPTRSP